MKGKGMNGASGGNGKVMSKKSTSKRPVTQPKMQGSKHKGMGVKQQHLGGVNS